MTAYYYQNNLLEQVFINDNNNSHDINCIKSNTKLLLENKINIKNLNYILESNRTIVGLLFHENLINSSNYLKNKVVDPMIFFCDKFIYVV